MKDLGDRSLETMIKESKEDFLFFFYEQAMRLLLDMQHQTTLHPDLKCVAFHRRFDGDLLFWELNHFVEYGIEDRCRIKMNLRDKELFSELGHKLCQEISHMPSGFTHRDFQSRNLMLHNYGLWMIDFQDALQGPLLYDLVALLRDSYINIEPVQLAQLLTTFRTFLPKEHPYAGKSAQLQKDFDLITVQRKLKDAGRFQYIKTVKGNPNFLVHVPHSLQSVKLALERLPEYAGMGEMIGKYVPEFHS
jgi:aminoglycoside/choline kinase family phosphotransferase